MAKAKRIKGIDCHGAASIGIKLVLITRFGELYDLREAALDWSDPEGVHSMRVASRRLRSTLRDFVPYLRKRGLTSIQKQLKSVADALGEVRDQDVAIMALEKIRPPEALSPPIKQFIDTRKKLRDEAREELEAILEKSQLEQLAADFIAGVEKATAINERKPAPSTGQTTFMRVSRTIILDRLKELEKLSGGLFKPFDVKTLHDMRIAAKRLRYAVELFQPCWGHAIGSYAKRVARIQSALGEVHDCDVWIESLGKPITDAHKQKQHQHVEAFVWLMNHFIKLRTKHLRQAFSRWRDWEAQDLSAKLRATLAQKAQ
jgi:CHAD domain-containing protein